MKIIGIMEIMDGAVMSESLTASAALLEVLRGLNSEKTKR